MTLIEMLIALLIVGICIASMVSLWQFSYSLTNQNDAKGAAYNIARKTIERFKQSGPSGQSAFNAMKTVIGANNSVTACLYYPATSSYVSAIYYDSTGSGENSTQQSTSIFKVTAVATPDKVTSDTPQAVAADALIAVDVTVTQLTGNRPVTYRTGTYLVRSGV